MRPEFLQAQRIVAGNVAGVAEIADEFLRQAAPVEILGVGVQGQVADRVVAHPANIQIKRQIDQSIGGRALARATGRIAEDFRGKGGAKLNAVVAQRFADAAPIVGEEVLIQDRVARRRQSRGQNRRGCLAGRSAVGRLLLNGRCRVEREKAGQQGAEAQEAHVFCVHGKIVVRPKGPLYGSEQPVPGPAACHISDAPTAQ